MILLFHVVHQSFGIFKLFIAIDATIQVDLATYVVDEFDLLVEIELHLLDCALVIKFVHKIHVVQEITKVCICGRTKEANRT